MTLSVVNRVKAWLAGVWVESAEICSVRRNISYEWCLSLHMVQNHKLQKSTYHCPWFSTRQQVLCASKYHVPCASFLGMISIYSGLLGWQVFLFSLSLVQCWNRQLDKGFSVEVSIPFSVLSCSRQIQAFIKTFGLFWCSLICEILLFNWWQATYRIDIIRRDKGKWNALSKNEEASNFFFLFGSWHRGGGWEGRGWTTPVSYMNSAVAARGEARR